MAKTKWSTFEEKYLLENYYHTTIDNIAKYLNRTKSSVNNKVYLLIPKNNSRKKTGWTDEEINILIDNYNGLTYKELSKLLNKSEISIDKRLRILNVTRTKSVFWTEDDEIFLEINWGIKSIDWIGKKLGRTPGAIRRRGYDKGLGGMYRNGYHLTVTQISDVLNVDPSTIYNWIKTKKLKSINKTFDKQKCIFVKFEILYQFLKENQKLWNATKLEYLGLNKEEDWLIKKRKEDNNELKNKSNTPWTRREEEQLIKMLSENRSLYEITKAINRTKDSISSKRKELRKQNRLIPLNKEIQIKKQAQ